MKVTTFAAAVLAMGFIAGLAQAKDLDQRLDELEAQIQAQRQRIAQQDAEISQLKGQDWMTERRAEEVKALIHEVLSDAETRASLLDSDMTAGWNKHFYLASADGKFLMNVAGQLQIRYVWNSMDVSNREAVMPDSDAADVNGFEIRRAKVKLFGHIGDPKVKYMLTLASATSGYWDDDNLTEGRKGSYAGDVAIEDAWASYQFDCGAVVRGGQFKAPFLREQLVDSSQQLAVERSYVSDYMGVGRTQGAEVSYRAEKWGVAVMIHDGTNAYNTEHPNDVSDFALAARGEVLLAGAWDNLADFRGNTGTDLTAMIGAAIDWESDDTQMTSTASPTGGTVEILKWTVDASVEVPDLNNLSFFAAVVGADYQAHNPDTTAFDGTDQLGFVVQGGIDIIPDKLDAFVRYEWLDQDGFAYIQKDAGGEFAQLWTAVDDDNLSFITFGFNYYLTQHASKFTVDFTWALDQVTIADTGAGIDVTDTTDDSQFILRFQYQLLF